MTRRCNTCGEVKPLDEFYLVRRAEPDGERHRRCKPCVRASVKQWQIDNKDKLRVRQRRYYRKCMYGLTEEAHDVLLAKQGGKCAICGKPPGEFPLHVDHDHKTGAVRGLLCRMCNKGLGHFQDSPDRLRAAAEYLEHPTTTAY